MVSAIMGGWVVAACFIESTKVAKTIGGPELATPFEPTLFLTAS